MSSLPTSAPYTESKSATDLPKWKKVLYGFTKDAPENSPYKWESRRAVDQAKQIDAMTTGNPTQEALAYAYGVAPGTDLSSYIQASRTGTLSPMYKPAPDAPTQKMAQGGVMSLRKFADGGASKPKAPPLSAAARQALAGNPQQAAMYAAASPAQKLAMQKQYGFAPKGATLTNPTGAAAPAPTSAPSPTGGAPVHTVAQGMDIQTPYYDPTSKQAQPYGGVTDPNFQKAVDAINNLKLPGQFQQGTDIMNQAAQGLFGASNYSPQQVSYQDAAAQQAAAQGYDASLMQAPGDISSQNYDAAQMQGPGSWTEEGVQQKYMNPYIQGVIDVSKRQKALDYQNQVNALNKQALSAGAFGGSRQALQRSQASKDYQQQLQDLEAQGLNQAYMQGMQQYGSESALTQQARQSNQAATNAQRSQYIQQALQAAMTNYGGQLTAAQQNSVAQNAAAQFNAGAQNQASLTNAQLGTNVNIQNAANQLAAQQYNQSAGLQANQMNLGALSNAGNLGQGIGGLGAQIGNLQWQIPGMYGQGATGSMGAGGNWANNLYTSGKNWNQYDPFANVKGTLAGTPGGVTTGSTSKIPGG